MTNCAVLLGWAVFLIPLGALFCYVSVVAWRNPSSKLVQSTFAEPYPTEHDAERIYRNIGWKSKDVRNVNLSIMKIAGPIFGIALLTSGATKVLAYLSCLRTH